MRVFSRSGARIFRATRRSSVFAGPCKPRPCRRAPGSPGFQAAGNAARISSSEGGSDRGASAPVRTLSAVKLSLARHRTQSPSGASSPKLAPHRGHSGWIEADAVMVHRHLLRVRSELLPQPCRASKQTLEADHLLRVFSVLLRTLVKGYIRNAGRQEAGEVCCCVAVRPFSAIDCRDPKANPADIRIFRVLSRCTRSSSGNSCFPFFLGSSYRLIRGFCPKARHIPRARASRGCEYYDRFSSLRCEAPAEPRVHLAFERRTVPKWSMAI